LRWTPTLAQIGNHNIAIALADNTGASIQQNFTLKVEADAIAPKVTVNPSIKPVDLGQPVTLFVNATDNIGVKFLNLTVNGKAVTLDADGLYTFTPDTVGTINAVATAIDAAGNQTTATTTFEVLDFSDVTAPVVKLPSLSGTTITSATEIVGTVTDDNLLYYTLSVAQSGTNDFKEIFRGTNTVSNGVLGSFDPSLLQNDAYTLRLTAVDKGGNNVFVEETVNIEGSLKLGNFQLSFTDLTLPVSGIPITVTRTYEYDALGRLTDVVQFLNQSSTNPQEIRTEYGYDELGRLIWIEDANDHKTAYEYDLNSRQTAVTLSLSQRSTTTYDAVGNVRSITDFNGDTITYSYNEQNRLIHKQLSDQTSVSFTYTPTGQRKSVTDNRGTTTYSYNEREQLISRFDPDGKAISYTYDLAGNRTSVTTPSGTVNYTFDEWNRLKTVRDADEKTTTYLYDAVSNLIRTQLPNGVVETRAYDKLNRLIELENKLGERVISSYEYTLDKVGHRQSVKEHDGRVVEYKYDDLYRLIEEKITDPSDLVNNGRTIGYVYDKVGNRLTKTDSVEGVTNYNYNANDLLLNETLVKNGVTISNSVYNYDNNGSTISRLESGSQKTVYDWNFENRLSKVILPDGKEVTYQYDVDGVRVASLVDGISTEYLVDTNRDYAQVLEEYVDERLNVSYVYGLDLISQERETETSIYLVDGLGSTRVLTDSNGIVTNTYTYEAFGNLIESSENTANSYRYAGEQWDENLDQYYLRQRYYDAGIGRFTRRDTYEGRIEEPVTLHKYLYAHANPVDYTDPSGLLSISSIGDFIVANKVQLIIATLATTTAYYGLSPYVSDLGTRGRASIKEPPINNKVVVEVYSWNGAPWGHTSINIDGTIYNQGGGNPNKLGSSASLLGAGWYSRKAESAWYNQLRTNPNTERLQRYSISLNSADKQRAKNYLDQEFEKASTEKSPDPAHVRLINYNFLTGNCTTTVTSALPWYITAAVPIAGLVNPPHLAASLNILSVLSVVSGVTRLQDCKINVIKC
jgi:RHS repeat-associated protein